MAEPSIGPPPSSTFRVAPTAEEVERFRTDGFIVVERIITDEELDWLSTVFDACFEKADGEPGHHPNRGNQTMFPELQFPEVLQSTFLRNARTYAAALLGVAEADLSTWGHLLRKPVGRDNNRLAPWHQDEAYWEPELRYHALGAWLPLHDVSVEQGAMQFIPGSHHLGVLPHHYWGDDAADNLLVVDDVPEVDLSTAVPCPLPKGGCTFHDQRTLHHTAPNTTDRPRRAYATELQVAPIRRGSDDAPDRPWVDQRRAVASWSPMTDKYLADGRLAPVG